MAVAQLCWSRCRSMPLRAVLPVARAAEFAQISWPWMHNPRRDYTISDSNVNECRVPCEVCCAWPRLASERAKLTDTRTWLATSETHRFRNAVALLICRVLTDEAPARWWPGRAYLLSALPALLCSNAETDSARTAATQGPGTRPSAGRSTCPCCPCCRRSQGRKRAGRGVAVGDCQAGFLVRVIGSRVGRAAK